MIDVRFTPDATKAVFRLITKLGYADLLVAEPTTHIVIEDAPPSFLYSLAAQHDNHKSTSSVITSFPEPEASIAIAISLSNLSKASLGTV